MRSKERIETFLNELKKFWETNQDLRFGQVIYMLVENLDVREGTDIFFPEDDVWLKALRKIKTPFSK
jgi:hypothetical protein